MWNNSGEICSNKIRFHKLNNSVFYAPNNFFDITYLLDKPNYIKLNIKLTGPCVAILTYFTEL